MKNSFAPYINDESKILILGTMPGEESLRLQQYYGNRGNHFWKLMFAVFDEDFSLDYTTRKLLLSKNKIALWDVLAYCEREGSLDSKIKNEIPNDFTTFFKDYPNIKSVCFSSKAALKYYDKFAIRLPNISYTVLPSPSGANASKSFSQKLAEWQILKVL